MALGPLPAATLAHVRCSCVNTPPSLPALAPLRPPAPSLVFEVPSVRIKFFGGSEYINLADTGGFVDNAGDQLYISSKAGRVARVRKRAGEGVGCAKGPGRPWLTFWHAAGLHLAPAPRDVSPQAAGPVWHLGAGKACDAGPGLVDSIVGRHEAVVVGEGKRNTPLCISHRSQIFRLMRMLRLYGLYEQYVRRRRIRAALEAAGSHFPVAATSQQLSMIEFEMQQEAEKKTRVGTKLEGGCGRGCGPLRRGFAMGWQPWRGDRTQTVACSKVAVTRRHVDVTLPR